MSRVNLLAQGCTTRSRVMGSECYSALTSGVSPRSSSSRTGSLLYLIIASVLFLLSMGQPLPAKAQFVLSTGQDIYSNGLRFGRYDLLLAGNVTWRTLFTINSVANSNIVIDGAGYGIVAGPSNSQRLLSFSRNADVSITNATITSQPFTGARYGLFRLDTSNTTVNLNLGGTTIRDIGPADYNSTGSADWGPIIVMRYGSNTVLNVDGGAAGVTFQGNHGLGDQPGVIGHSGSNAINFTGKVSFLNNWTANYGGAVTVYEYSNQRMTFAGETLFQNNYASVHGGAIDFWGGQSVMTFDGPVTFQGNFIYGTPLFSALYPRHNTGRHSRGGAIHIGYPTSGSNNINLTTNGTALFDGNYVIDVKTTTSNALGGAIVADSVGGNYSYVVNLAGPTTFSNNYVYSGTGSGFGGAVYYATGNNGSFTVGGGSSFLNNYAKTLGGAIYLESGNINLNANGGDITFQGNRQAASFAPVANLFVPVTGSGNPNAIYLNNSGSLNMDADAGSFIHFYDPIATRNGASVLIYKTGAGSVSFHGNSSNPGDPSYNSVVYVNTTVNGGTFALTDGVTYGVNNSGAFTVNDGGTVQGADDSTLAAFRIAINSGGGVAANGGVFNLNAGNGGVTSTAGIFTGFGSIVASSISLSGSAANISTADIASGDTLTLDTVLTGAGGLNKTGDGTAVLIGENTYTGGTTVSAGILQLGNGGSSGSVTGNIVDNAALVINRSDSVTLASVISGTGTLTQAGTGTTILTGTNTYSGGTTISAGTLQLGNGGSSGSIVGDIIDNASLVINRSDNVTLAGVISGSGSLRQAGGGTTILAGNNTYSGGTTISAGTLSISSDANLGAAGGPLTIGSGGTLLTTAGIVSARNVSLTGNGTIDNGGNVDTFSGVFSGAGSLTVAGGGTTILTGNNTYTGETRISAGTLQLGDGGNSGSITWNIIDNASLVINRSDSVTLAGVISGSGSLTQAGAGTTILTGDNTYTGATTISAGTLQLGDGGSSGSVKGDIIDNASLVINHSDNVTLAGVISGSGSLTQAGSGTTVLTGNNTYSGGTTISAGTLSISSDANLGAAGGPLTIESDGTLLTTAGIISARNVNLAGNGTIDDGGNVATFSGVFSGAGSLTVAGGGTTVLTGTNTYSGATTISAGTLQLGDGGSSGSVVGDIIDNASLVINRSDSVTLAGVISGSGSLTQAGSGTTILTGDNTYTGATTISAGTLQLGDGGSSGSIAAGDIINDALLVINRSDSVILADVISGTGSLTQAGSGTTILTGDNTYTGATTISAGILQLGDGGSSGSILGDIINDASLVIDRSDSVTLAGVISGTGSLTQAGSGTTILTGDNTYTGATTISAGTLQLGDGGSSGSIVGNIINNAALVIDRSDSVTLSGVISGSGSLTQAGSGTTILTSDNTYTGGTTISAGTLQLGNGGSSGSVKGDIIDNASLVIDRSDSVTLGGVISGSGSLTQAGSGTTILTGDNTYTGATTISAGTLQLGDGGSSGSIAAGDIINDALLVINRSDSVTLADVISGSGSLRQAGSGTTILTGDNTYTGATTISAGILQLGDGGSSGSILGDIINDAALVINRSDSVTLAGVISGAGSLRQAGSGTTILTGDNTYSGATTISAGTLQLGDGGSSGSILGDIINDASLVIDRSDSVTLAGVISGTGSLTQAGSGTTILTGDNTYSGATTISAGTLQLGDGGSSGSVVGDIIDNASLVINRSDNVTLAGVISGSGSLTQAGSGTTILTGDNTYSGATTISAGTLQLGDGGSSGSIAAGDIINDALLVINRSDSVTLVGEISGSGSLRQAGSGTTILTGNNTYTGGTTISAGILQLGDGGSSGSITGNIIDNAALVINRSDSVTLAGVISGAGSLRQAGAGTTILTGNNTYSGGTTISAGTLQLGNGGSSGSIVGNIIDNAALVINRSDSLTLAGVISGSGSLRQAGGGTTILTGTNTYSGGTTISTGTLQLGNGGGSGSIAGNIIDNAALVINRSDSVILAGVISGSGTLRQVGAGATILTGNNTYSGGTTISAGTLQLGNGGSSGSIVGNIIDNAALVINRSDSVTLSGVISGSGSLTQVGGGTTILTGTNTYSGGTTISAGILQLGNGGSSGSIAGNIIDNAALVIDRNDSLTLAGVISGSGSLTQVGSGTTILTGTNTYSGGTTISAGILQLGNGGSSGSIVGNIIDNAALVIDRNDSLTLAGVISGSGSLTQVGGGTTILTGTNTYSGGTTISAGTLQLGDGSSSGSIAGNIIDNAVLVINRSDSLTLAGVISGTGSLRQAGGGTTILTGTNTYSGGTTISAGILQLGDGGSSGSITGNIIDNAALVINRSGSVTLTGVISGTGSLTQAGAGTTILTGNNTYSGGTTINAGVLQLGNGGGSGSIMGNIIDNAALVINRSGSVTLAGVISGSGSLTQVGGGTAILTGNNTYTGGTTISAGTLQLGNGGGSGSIAGNIIDNAALVINRSGSLTLAGVISGSGTLTQAGGGATILTGTNTYSGGTTINAGVLQLGNGGSSGSITGNIVDNAALVINRSDNVTLAGVISGSGSLTQAGGGTTILTGNNTYAGGTTISVGILQLGNGGSSGSIVGDIIDNAALVIDRSDSLTLAGVISGAGTLTQAGGGATILTGTNTYSGGTTISSGTLQLGDGGSSGSIVGNIIDNSALVINRSGSVTLAGVISGTGTLTQAGGGATILTGTNTYSGGTTISAGTLQLGNGGSSGSIVGNIIDNSALVINRNNSVILAGVISGSGTLRQSGTGATILTGNNTYSGGTTISAGTLQLGDGGSSGSITGNIIDNAALVINRSGSVTLAGVISGSGTLRQAGTGATILTGDNTYTGGTTISAGTLQLGNGGSSGSIVGNIIDNAALVIDRSDSLTLAGVISGSGTLTQAGTGATILTGDNTYTGGTTISAGTLQLGNGGSSGSIVGNIIDNAALVIDRSDSLTLAGVISGNGSLTQAGSGATILTGSNTYTGDTIVSAGTLRVNGSTASQTTTVLSGAILGGSGDIGGDVTIQDGGHLSPGNSPGTLNIAGNLTLSSGSALDYELGEADVPGGPYNDLISVGGNLVLDGTLNISVTPGLTFGPGVYRLIDYAGTLTNNGLDFGTVPADFTPNVDLFIQTAVSHQVNLLNEKGAGALSFWDGGDSGLYGNDVVDGGSGTWTAASDGLAWTNAAGTVNAGWRTDRFAVFQSSPGTVTVDDSAGSVNFSGAQFAVDGYVIDGDPLTTTTADTIMRVGDGTAAGAGMRATIDSVIQGSGGIHKTDLGTLVLTGNNTYSGGTTISAGTLSISSDANLGAAGSLLTMESGGILLTTAGVVSARDVNLAGDGTIDNGGNVATFSGVFSGAGSLTAAGGGATVLTGNNTYSGGTTISAGTLSISSDANLGAAGGILTIGSGGTLLTTAGIVSARDINLAGDGTIDNGGSVATFSGVFSGAGSLTAAGGGATILTGTNTYTGGTTISAGTLQLGDGGSSGSIEGDIIDNALLVINRSDSMTLAGVISGSGSLRQAGSGATVLTGTNTYSGGTTISAGMLSISSDVNLGVAGGPLTIESGGTLLTTAGIVSARNVNLAGDGTIDDGGNVDTFSGVFSGAGSLTAAGGGITILTGDNTYSGGTTISAGTLQLGDGGSSGSVVGDIIDNAALVINRGDSMTLAGVISGSGSLRQAGSGTTVLTGNNTYSGGTTISSGTLSISSDTNLGAAGGSLTIGSGGTLLTTAGIVSARDINLAGDGTIDNGGSVATFSGVFSGAGSLTAAGDGATILTGTNTYTGGTTISAGTLQLGDGGSSGGIVGDIIDNAALVINRSDSLTLAGVISGSGTLTQAGGGVTILTGDDTYTGDTTISAGTLQLGDGGSSGSIVGNIIDNAALVINRNNSLTLAGVISGSGTLTQAGGGTTILTGDSTYTGGTTISAGTLQLGDGSSSGSIVGDIIDNAALVIDRSDDLTLAGVISGSGSLTQAGAGATILTGDNTYSGGTTISAGTLQLGNGGSSGSIVGDIIDNAALVIDRSDSLTLSGVISGTGSLTQAGAGITILTGDNTYSGETTISAGTLQLGDGGSSGSIVGDIIDNAALVIDRSDDVTLAGVISGTGSLTQAGAGTTILTGDSTYTGGTTISTGILQLGDGGSSGSIVGDIIDNASLVIDRSDSLTLAGVISGSGTLRQVGAGTTILTGDNTYSGGTTISAGILQLGNGSGSGSIVGDIIDNAALVIDRSDDLTLAGVISGSGSLTQAGAGVTILTGTNTYSGGTTISAGILQLGDGGSSGSIVGDIIDNAALVIDRSDSVTLAGVISGSGSLTQAGSGATILTGDSTYSGETTISAGILQLGDGGSSGSIVGDIIDNAALVIDRSDSVTLAGVISGSGSLTQAGSGATILTGDSTYSGGTTISTGILQLGNGGSSGSIVGDIIDNAALVIDRNDSLTLAGVISGTGSLTQVGGGTTVLTGTNTYGGGTTISAGTLQLGDGSSSGSIVGDIIDNASLVIDRSDSVTLAGVISGSGSLTQAGSGATILTGDSTYSGGTTISAGTLQLGNGGSSGSIVGDIIDNAALVIDRSDSMTLAGVISGTGTLRQVGTGTTILTGTNTYSGGTTISAGTLQLGNGGSSGSITGNIIDNAALVINRSDSLTLAGVISGTGTLRQAGTGATILTGTNTYSGGTTISAGTLQLGNGGGSGSITGNIIDNAALVINRNNSVTLAGVISGSGTLTQAGSGTTVLTGNSTYSGGTTISAGILQLGNGGSSGSIMGNIVDNAALVINRSDNVTLAGVISGSGTLTQAGGGATILTGTNTYSGGTTISAGTLQLGNGGSSGSITGNIIDNAALVINRSDSLTLAGVISGTGTLRQAGTGATILTGTNTYSGGTTISSGALQLGNGGSSGSIVGNIVDNAALVINRSDGLTLAGVISGTGSLTQAGGGATILTGTNTYTGGTTISAGTLQLGNGGGSGSITGNIVDNAALVINRNNSVTLAGVISGTGTLTQLGAGTTVLTGTNTYSGGTTISAGILQLGNGGGSGSITGDIVDNAALVINRSGSVTLAGVISGSGTLTQAGGGATILTGTNTYSGGTTISAGTLQLGNGGSSGSITGNIVDNAALVIDRSDSMTLAGVISGTGSLRQAGGGATILTGTNTYSGGTTISAGTLQLGNGGSSGSITGNIVDNAALAINRSDNLTLAGVISGSGSLTQAGSGATILTGSNTYTGDTIVSAGTLRVNGSTASQTTTVLSGATLGGSGDIGGDVTIQDGGHLSPGNSPGTLNIAGNLTLSSGSALDYELGEADVPGGPYNDLISVGGNLVLDGILNVSVTPGRTFDPGVYRLIDYAGTLTNNGLSFGAMPAGFTPNVDLFIQTAVSHQVNLLNEKGLGPLSFWDGGDSGLYGNDAVDGGNGTWTALSDGLAWTNAAGTLNAGWRTDRFAVFQSSPGTVTVDDSAGSVNFSGAQFAVDGYVIDGDPLTTTTADTIMRVGDGTAAGAGMRATIDSVIQGSGGIHKTDLGTLVLTGNNTYSGGTTISAGTLSISSDANLGAAGGILTMESGGILLTTAGVVSGRDVNLAGSGTINNGGNVATFSGVFSGAGSLTAAGGGATVLTGTNTYSGGTTISAGTLQLGDGGSSGSITGNIIDNAALVINRSDSVTLANVISGTGTLRQAGGGTTILTGNSTYRGGTTISAGTLQLGNGGSSGSIVGDITDNAALVIDRSDSLTLAGVISGTGTLMQAGSGVTILTGDNTYTGDTTISAGTLQLGNGGSSGSIAGNIIDNAALVIDRSDSVTLAGMISGSGSLTQAGSGATILTGDSTYSGGTTISAGTLQLGDGGGSGSIAGDIIDNAVLVIDRSDSVTLAGVISGTGILWQVGGGTTTLTGNNTYSGGTTISGGTLSISNDANLGAAGGLLTMESGGILLTTAGIVSARNVILADNGTIDNGGNVDTFSGVLDGAGSLTVAGSGTTIFTGNNMYSGGTTISAGTLQLGDGGSSGGIVGDIIDNAALVINRSDSLTLAGVISGSGTLTQAGGGVTILTGDNTYTGDTIVSAGTLRVNGSTASQTTTVLSGATLGGSGDIGGDVTIQDGGHLSPGNSPGTLNIAGNLTLSSGSALDYELGEADVPGGPYNDLISVGGNLVLDGILNVSVTPGRTFDPGVYRLIDYAGTLTNNGLSFGTVPVGFTPNVDLFIQAAVPNQVNLLNEKGLGPLSFWDGGDSGLYGNGVVNGGSGTWTAFSDDRSWTNAAGTVNAGWRTDRFAVFQSSPGTVTVDDSAGSVNFSGAQFAVDGYVIDGDPLTTTTADTIMRVGDGTAAGAGMRATIDSVIQGSGGIHKTDLGTLVLTGNNTYSGGTTISAGTLSISSDANLGAAGSLLTMESGGILLTTAGVVSGRDVNLAGSGTINNGGNVATFSGVFSGAGSLTAAGGGATVLTGNNTYSGGTTISAGTLSISSDANLGAAGGSLTIGSGGTLLTTAGVVSARNINLAGNGTIDNGGNVDTFSGVLSGAGSLTAVGGGVTILTGANTYSGGTTISAGTLQLGDGGSSGSIEGDIIDNAALVIDRSDSMTLEGVISGSGTLTQAGTGATVLTGNSTYTGGTTISAGTLQLGNGGSSGSIVGDIIDNASLVIDRSDSLTLAGVISGSGTLTQAGAGTTILTGDNTYTGATTISAGILQLGNGGGSGSIAGDIIDNAALVIDRSDSLTLAGVISGSGTLRQVGSGATILTGSSTYTGGTTISAGTLQLGDGGSSGSIVGDIIDNAALVIDRSGSLTLAGVISGSGTLTQAGSGVTILTGTNTYTGGTTISAGTLQLGDGGSSGSVAGDIIDNAALVIDRSGSLTLAGVISGSGTLTQAGSGATILTGSNTYTGDTTVSSGTLRVNGSIASRATTVLSGATLGGSGVIGGDVTIQDGGHLDPGNSPGTLRIAGNLTLFPSSALDYELGQVDVPGGPYNDLVSVGGDLVLDGTLNVSVVPGHTLSPGVYRLINYAGALTNNELSLGNVPAGFTPNVDLFIQAAVPQEVNLLNEKGLGPFAFWDGGDSSLYANGVVDGGNGTWTAFFDGRAWANASGTLNIGWRTDRFAVFQNRPGTVTVDDSAGSVIFSGAQFTVDGYVIDGDPLTTTTADTIMRVGDGTVAGAEMSATIDSVIQGSGGLHKSDLGRLILTGVNTYTGGTNITSGILLVGDSLGTGAELAGGGEVLVGVGGALGGYGKVTGTVVNDGLVGVGNALSTLAMPNVAAASFFAAGAAVAPVLGANNSSFTVVGDFDNRGVITMEDGVAGDQMIVNGIYTSDGGRLLIDTVLNEGGANAQSDMLVVDATSLGAGGATRITVNQVGGGGALTQQDGIQVVFVSDPALSVADAFVLDERVVAGAYEYSLFMGGVSDPADGQWYLRSARMGYRPEVMVYLANQHLAGAMFVHSLHDRLDDPGFVARQDFDAFDAPRDRPRSGWLRTSRDWDESRSESGDFKVDSNTVLIQGGIELAEWRGAGEEDDEESGIHVGVMGSYGNVNSRAQAVDNSGDARGEVEGVMAGAYGTWYQDEEKKFGAYVDTWFQYGWFSNQVKGDKLPTVKYRTQGWAVSGEVGYALPLGNDWVVEPQAQLLYVGYRDDGLSEANGTQVSWADSAGWMSRLGVRTYWTSVSEDSRKIQPYVTVNWLHAGRDRQISFDQKPVGSPYASDRYELKLGVSGDLDQGWTGWANVSGAWDGHGSHQYVLRAGVSYTW